MLYRAEANLSADTTQERWPPHFHVVVIPETEVLMAESDSATTGGGQGE